MREARYFGVRANIETMVGSCNIQADFAECFMKLVFVFGMHMYYEYHKPVGSVSDLTLVSYSTYLACGSQLQRIAGVHKANFPCAWLYRVECMA